jgi:ABC-type multidrug transport system ATPase subunit
VRRHLGVCPQHNVLYPNLTVEEHLLLFSLQEHLSLALFAIELLKIKVKVGVRVSALQHIKHNQPIKLNAFDSL